MGMTQEEVAKALGISVSTIYRRFKKYGWQARCTGKRLELDEDEIHRLYFKEKLTQEEAAKTLGISRRTVVMIFKRNDWAVRSRKIHESKSSASRERGKHLRLRIKALREQLFGTTCRICGKERNLAIHRKDGKEHDKDALWRVRYLQSIDAAEWAALCIPCHRGVHWLAKEKRFDWNRILEPVVNLTIS